MKILPRRISKMTTISTSPNENYGLHIDAVDKNKSIMILGKKLNENVDETVLKDLVDKYAYASALLYFTENFKIIDNINKDDLLEDINVLLHSRCRVVKEKAPELVRIGEYPLYEGANYVLRGDGENKIRECFNLKEDIEMGDISMDYLNNAEVDEVIKDFVVCPHCKNVYEESAIKIDYPDILDDYNGPVDDEPIGYECPYCGFHSVHEESFSDAWLDDLKDAPNIGEYLDVPINESEKYTKNQVKLKIQKFKRLCMNIQKNIAQYKFGRRARVGCNFDENGDVSNNRIRIETDYIQELDPAYVTQSISDIVKSYIPEAKLDDVQIRTSNYTKYNYKRHKDTAKIEGVRTCYYIVPGTINEEAGTQASDIATKVDYTFQSAPTPANPGKKKKFEAVEIKELDESTHLNLTGFIKDIDGLYKRGDYIIVKESATGKITAIHKSRLNEEVEEIKEETITPESIAKGLEDKLNQAYSNRFEIKTTPADNVYALVITDKSSDKADDLVEVTDVVNSAMESLNYSKKDYEINYKKNNLVVIIYNAK